jgi:alanine racemase
VYQSNHPDRVYKIKLHLKLETGNHRQGVGIEDALILADLIKASPFLELEGICSHFANVEDTTEHHYAKKQLQTFQEMAQILKEHGHEIKIKHMANSAASILWPDACMDMVRIGISAYGLWPSKESKVLAQYLGNQIQLKPALQWKTKVMQIKQVGVGQSIGYGCTYTTTHPITLAILPVGYYEGYDRGLSNLAYVLIKGQRAHVRGRICMNITMVDITDIPDVQLEDEVILLGSWGDEVITAEQVASWAGTINYEVITRIAGHLPRIAVE